jgi:hypothetical protein
VVTTFAKFFYLLLSVRSGHVSVSGFPPTMSVNDDLIVIII